MPRIPKAGDSLELADFNEILDALATRKRNFPTEPEDMRLGTVLFNIGDRFTKVVCVNGEWNGMKKDASRSVSGIPLCPNGHVMFETDPGPKLGWVAGH